MEMILLSLTVLMAVALPHFRVRNHILVANIALVGLYAMTMVIEGIMLGALIYSVAVLGSVMQLVVRDDVTWFSLSSDQIRLVLATLLVCVGAVLLYETPIDLLAVAGFAAARFAETRPNPLHMKQGFMISSLVFLTFMIVSGSSVAIAQFALVMSLSLALGWAMFGSKKLQPALQAAE